MQSESGESSAPATGTGSSGVTGSGLPIDFGTAPERLRHHRWPRRSVAPLEPVPRIRALGFTVLPSKLDSHPKLLLPAFGQTPLPCYGPVVDPGSQDIRHGPKLSQRGRSVTGDLW